MNWLEKLRLKWKRLVSNYTNHTFVSEKYIYHKRLSIRQRFSNFKSWLEEITNYRSWKDDFFTRLIDWFGTLLLLTLAVVFIASERIVLLAIGLFIAIELGLSYLKEVVKIIKDKR